MEKWRGLGHVARHTFCFLTACSSVAAYCNVLYVQLLSKTLLQNHLIQNVSAELLTRINWSRHSTYKTGSWYISVHNSKYWLLYRWNPKELGNILCKRYHNISHQPFGSHCSFTKASHSQITLSHNGPFMKYCRYTHTHPAKFAWYLFLYFLMPSN